MSGARGNDERAAGDAGRDAGGAGGARAARGGASLLRLGLSSALLGDAAADRKDRAMTAVSAVLVTRGDVDMTPIIDSLPVDWDWLVYDNSDRRRDLAVYGR